MKEIVKKIKINLFTYLMISIMGMFIANKAIFVHSHKMVAGTIISHSHPYDRSDDSEPYKSHKHTKVEILFFKNLEILLLTVFLICLFIRNTKKIIRSAYILTNYTPACIIPHQGRAPPVL